MDLQTVFNFVKVIFINFIMSADNAIVIALACSHLPSKQRNRAMLVGGIGAVLARIILTFIAVLLLKVHFLKAIGGVFLVFVAWKLVNESESENHRTNHSFWVTVGSIVFADVLLSLDNALAVAGIAGSNLLVTFGGLAISMVVCLAGSQLLTNLMSRFPIIKLAGAWILCNTAIKMIFEDESLSNLVNFPLHSFATISSVFAASALIVYVWVYQTLSIVYKKKKIEKENV